MMRIAVFIFSLIAFGQAVAEDRAMKFSKYSSDFRLMSYDERESRAEFRGSITVHGVLYFQFDDRGDGRMDGVNFARFVPDRASFALLPSVIAGPFAAPIKYISLEPAELMLEQAVGADEAMRLSHGTASEIRRVVRVTIRRYTASIECDSRAYWSTDSVVAPSPMQHDVSIGDAPIGC